MLGLWLLLGFWLLGFRLFLQFEVAGGIGGNWAELGGIVFFAPPQRGVQERNSGSSGLG